MYAQRLIICMIGGAVAAAICIGGMYAGGQVSMSAALILSTAGNRLLIGFVIAVSGWRIHYLLHGALIGLIVTLSTAVVIIPQDLKGFLYFTIAGVLYGTLIELAATRLFNAAME
jgi:hypothetical protein